MDTQFDAKVYRVGDDVNMDKMLGSEILTEQIRKQAPQLGMAGNHPASRALGYELECATHKVLLAGKNFGGEDYSECLAARLSESGVVAVIAESYHQEFCQRQMPEKKPMHLMFVSGMPIYMHTGNRVTLRLVGDDVKVLCRVPLEDGCEYRELFQVRPLSE